MSLDVQTLLVTMMVNVIALSVALPAIMGWHVSRAARCAQGAAALQAAGWVSVTLAAGWYDRPLSTLAMACLACGHALMWESYRGWLGPRPGRRLVWALALAVPVGYGLGFGHYAFRVGWANAGLALQLATVALVLFWPLPAARGARWRWLVGGALAAMAVVTAWRGVLGAFFTASYPTLRTPHPVNLAAALLSNLTLLLNAVSMLVAWREEAELQLRAMARTDSLTGLLNRRALHDGARDVLARARSRGTPVALLLIDLDHFKAVNDGRGHQAGDRALQLVARQLGQALRHGDLAARWGGEEFCVLLDQADAESATAFDQGLRAQLLRLGTAELGFALGHSTGLAVLGPDDAGLDALLQRADTALYRAKAAGRGQLCGPSENASADLARALPHGRVRPLPGAPDAAAAGEPRLAADAAQPPRRQAA